MCAALLERNAAALGPCKRAQTPCRRPGRTSDKRIVLSEVNPLRLRGPLCAVVTAAVKSERGWPTPEQRGADGVRFQAR